MMSNQASFHWPSNFPENEKRQSNKIDNKTANINIQSNSLSRIVKAMDQKLQKS